MKNAKQVVDQKLEWNWETNDEMLNRQKTRKLELEIKKKFRGGKDKIIRVEGFLFKINLFFYIAL